MSAFVNPAREHPYDIELNGQGYMFASKDNGSFMWADEPVEEVAGKTPGLIPEERRWDTWHLGAGYSERLYPGTYTQATNMDLRFPRQGIAGPRMSTSANLAFPPISLVELSANKYVFLNKSAGDSHTYVAKLTTTLGDGGETLSLGTATALANNVNLTQAIAFDGKAYAFFAASAKIYSWDGTTATQATDDVYGTYAAVGWLGTHYRLARSTGIYVGWCDQGDDPLVAANWSDGGVTADGYVIGDAGANINALAFWQGMLFAAKGDGLYALEETGRAVKVLDPGCNNAVNGLGLYVGPNGWVYYPTIAGLYRYNPATSEINDVTPGRTLGQSSGPVGRVHALRHYRSWLHAVVQNSATSWELWAGREREADESGFGPMVWHGALYCSTATTATFVMPFLHVDTATTSPLLVFPSYATVNTGYLSACRLSSYSDNPLNDPNYKYTTAAQSMRLPTDDWQLPGGYFQLRSVVLDSTAVNATRNVVVKCSRDDAAAETLATVTTANRQVTNISTDKRFSRAYFQLEPTAEAATTPVLRSLAASASRRVPTSRLIKTTLICDDRKPDFFGNSLRRSGAEQVAELEVLHTAAPVTLIDWQTGSSRSRTVLVAPVREVVLNQDVQGKKTAVSAVEVEMLVIA